MKSGALVLLLLFPSVLAGITMPDSVPPQINSVVYPQLVNDSDTFDIVVNATDNEGLGAVTLFLDGAENQMQAGAGPLYSKSFPKLGIGQHSFYVRVVDLAGNPVTSTTYSMTSRDGTPPNITIIGMDQYYVVSLNISDNVAVSSAEICILENHANISMGYTCEPVVSSGGGKYVYDLGSIETGTYGYFFYAYDVQGNRARSPAGNGYYKTDVVKVEPPEPQPQQPQQNETQNASADKTQNLTANVSSGPVISLVTYPGVVFSDEQFNMTCKVQADSGVASVKLIIEGIIYNMSSVGGGVYAHTHTAPSSGYLSFYITATDKASVLAKSDTYLISIFQTTVVVGKNKTANETAGGTSNITEAKTEGAPGLELETETTNVMVAQGAKAEFKVTLMNTGNATLSGLKVSAKPEFVTAGAVADSIEAGKSLDVKFTVSPLVGHPPAQYTSVVVEVSSGSLFDFVNIPMHILIQLSKEEVNKTVQAALGAKMESAAMLSALDAYDKSAAQAKAFEDAKKLMVKAGWDYDDAVSKFKQGGLSEANESGTKAMSAYAEANGALRSLLYDVKLSEYGKKSEALAAAISEKEGQGYNVSGLAAIKSSLDSKIKMAESAVLEKSYSTLNQTMLDIEKIIGNAEEQQASLQKLKNENSFDIMIIVYVLAGLVILWLLFAVIGKMSGPKPGIDEDKGRKASEFLPPEDVSSGPRTFEM